MFRHCGEQHRYARTNLERRPSSDYLINNAGRSIRRGIVNSFDRFHDFERTLQLTGKLRRALIPMQGGPQEQAL